MNYTKNIAVNCNILWSILRPWFELLSGSPRSCEADLKSAGEGLHCLTRPNATQGCKRRWHCFLKLRSVSRQLGRWLRKLLRYFTTNTVFPLLFKYHETKNLIQAEIFFSTKALTTQHEHSLPLRRSHR